MLYLVKFLLVTQLLTVLTFTNNSTIYIKSPIKSINQISGATLSGISYSQLIPNEQIKFNRVKKKIMSEFKQKNVIEVYDSSNEFWIVYDNPEEELLTLYIFEVSGKYMDVYEYELTTRQLVKLLEKKKREVKNNYFIENY
jgi:hypothetical protein